VSHRPQPQMSPINSTGVTIVIDRTNSDDTEPTVVLGSTVSDVNNAASPRRSKDNQDVTPSDPSHLHHSVFAGARAAGWGDNR